MMNLENKRGGAVKRVIAILATLLATIALASGISLANAETAWADGYYGGVYWSIGSDKVLNIVPADTPQSGFQTGEIPTSTPRPWNQVSIQGNMPITSVVIHPGVRPTGSLVQLFQGWTENRGYYGGAPYFYGCYGVTSISFPDSFDTSLVTDMSGMFHGCYSLTDLTLPDDFNTSLVTDMSNMFNGCTNLRTITVASDFDTTYVQNSENMFNGCTNLRGDNGTTYDATHIDASYAKIDSGPNGPGYFTQLSYGTILLQKTVHAPESVNTDGISYTYTFTPTTDPTVLAEAGIEVAPPAISQVVVELDAMTSAMSGEQVIVRNVQLPNPALFPHAGVYAYDVTEVASTADDTTHWENSQATYRVRLYVENEVNTQTGAFTGNPVYAANPVMIETLTDEDGHQSIGTTLVNGYVPYDESVHADLTRYSYDSAHDEYIVDANGDYVQGEVQEPTGYGEKVPRLAFAANYIATQDLSVSKNVTGAYADRTFQFPFVVTLVLPDYSTDTTAAYTLVGGASLNYATLDASMYAATTATTGTVTITNHVGVMKVKLADGQGVTFSGLPVGTRYTVNEVSSVDGVNVYIPTAQYTYASTNLTDSGYTTLQNTVANTTPVTSNFMVENARGDMNTQTIVGDAAGNAVVFSNALDNPPSPTGIIMYAAPIALPLVVLCTIAAIGIWQLNRRRKEIKNDVSL